MTPEEPQFINYLFSKKISIYFQKEIFGIKYKQHNEL